MPTPSSSYSHLNKRPKVVGHGSYAQATKSSVKMALILEGYPGVKLDASELSLIHKALRKKILGLSKDTRHPKFEGVSIRDGAVVVNCAVKKIGTWLKSLSQNLSMNNRTLLVVSEKEFPKRHLVIVHVGDPDQSIDFLDRQNVGLAAREWWIRKGSDSRDSQRSHFAALIPDQSLVKLKACNFKSHCGLSRALIKPLVKEKREGSNGGNIARGTRARTVCFKQSPAPVQKHRGSHRRFLAGRSQALPPPHEERRGYP